MSECNKCRLAIRGENGISCGGVCGKVFHVTKKCAGIDQYSAKTVDENKFIRYICDDCMQYIINIDVVLKEIQDEVIKNKQNQMEYKNEFKSSLKQSENEIQKILEAIETNYEERINKMINLQKSCEKNVEEVKKLFGNISEIEKNNKKFYQTIGEKNETMCKEIKKVISESCKKTSYADIIRNKGLPDVSKQVPLIVKPKEKQSADKTKEELNKVNPVDLKITNVLSRRSGTIIIQSENDEEREKIKSAIQDKISEQYEIRVPSTEYKIKITGMTFEYNENEIIDKIKKQNPNLASTNFTFIEKYRVKRNNKTTYNVKLKIDSESYTKIMEEGRVNIGWERCRVYDGTEVIQCLKCKGYNHLAKDCRNQEICLKCHGQHRTKNCENQEQIMKCINCLNVNKKLNMGLDENHFTNDRECPVYQNKLKNKMKSIGLSA